MNTGSDWTGAKLALFLGENLAVIQRDERPGLLWAGQWDLPGGKREPDETPLECALRETHEELSLRVPAKAVLWGRAYLNSIGQPVWFFAARLAEHHARTVRLGPEGQRWALMSPAGFLGHPRVVEAFKPRLQDYLEGVESVWTA